MKGLKEPHESGEEEAEWYHTNRSVHMIRILVVVGDTSMG